MGITMTNEDGSDNNIRPHVIIFDDDSVKKVIPKFCKLVKKFKDEGRLPANHGHNFNAIAWRSGKDGKFGLKNYWDQYVPAAGKTSIEHPCLRSYAFLAKGNTSDTKGLRVVHKSLIDAVLKILRLEGVTEPESKRYFTASNLKKHLKEEHEKLYDLFRLRLFEWSLDIYRGNNDKVYQAIRQAIPKILKFCFGIELNKASDFVYSEVSSSEGVESTVAKSNIYQCPDTGIKVKVGSVHSVKGKTHAATLYLESYYFKDGTGANAKSYESQRLKEQFEGECVAEQARHRHKQSAKMVYVGFSRPTHLLCFAVHRDRYDTKVFQNNWQEVLLQ